MTPSDLPIREPDQIRKDCACKLRAVEVSEHFQAILGYLPIEDRTTTPVGRDGHTPDGHLLGRCDGEMPFKASLGQDGKGDGLMPEANPQDDITSAVEESISTLVGLFEKEPTRFFTENDLVCCFHRMLHEKLTNLGRATAFDKDENPHNLIHCEYPTPFRCDMGGSRFEVKTDDDPTPGGKKYRRGMFDVVVLNPSFVARHSYGVVKSQTFATFQEVVQPSLIVTEPVVHYGIEFVFRRDEIKPSRGGNWELAAKAFIAEVHQDAAKLTEASRKDGFMNKAVTLVFVKGTTGKVMDLIESSVQKPPLIRLSMAP